MSNISFSPFEILRTRITHLNMNNSIFNYDDNAVMNNLTFNVEIDKIQQKKGFLFGTMRLKMELRITDKESYRDTNAFINLTIEGDFRIPEENGEEKFKNLLHVNGAATLYSIARSFLISVTSQSFSRGYVTLPLVNFNALPQDEENE